MAARIIPFPKLTAVNEGPAPLSTALLHATEANTNGAVTGLHLVRTSVFARTQQTARRIVEDVCLEHHLAHPALESGNERPSAFWATLPLPPARVETPLTVAKRLAHMILPAVEHAW